MEKRLVSAYDKMTMPEGCSQHIEEALRQKRQPERGRYTAVLNQADSRKAWRSSLAGVCLAVLLMVGGTALFVKTQGRIRNSGTLDAPVSSSATEAPAATEKELENIADVPYGAEADVFLKDMCRYMPDWNGRYSLDDYFWRDFLYNSFSDYQKTGMMVDTIAGQVPRLGGTVMVSREQAKNYAMLAMGVELPEFKTEGMGEGLSYADGYYRVTPQGTPVVLQDIVLETSLEESDYEKNTGWEYCTVVYRVSASKEGEALSSSYVSFYLKKAENQNGFVILAKTTSQDLCSYENKEIEAVARAFGEAYLASDAEAMRGLMTSRSDWDMNSVQSVADETQYEVSEVSIYRGVVETLGGNPVACVHYRYLWPDATEYADSTWGIYLEMEQTREGWKVRYSHDGLLDEVFKDRDSLRDVADKFAGAYFAGDKDSIRALMREGTTRDVLVYEGDPEDVNHWYVNIVGVSPGVKPEAQVRIDYYVPMDHSGDTEEVPREADEHVLVVTMVRLEEGWVLDSYQGEITRLGITQDNGGEKLEK